MCLCNKRACVNMHVCVVETKGGWAVGREVWGCEGKPSHPCCHGTESWQRKMEGTFPQV